MRFSDIPAQEKKLQSIEDALSQHPRKSKFLLFKNYLDTGRSLLGYFNPIFTGITYGFGITSVIQKNTEYIVLMVGIEIIHNILALFLGYGWYKYGWQEINNEVGNYFNPTLRRVEKRLEKL